MRQTAAATENLGRAQRLGKKLNAGMVMIRGTSTPSGGGVNISIEKNRTGTLKKGFSVERKNRTGTLKKGFNVVMDEVEPFDFFIEKK